MSTVARLHACQGSQAQNVHSMEPIVGGVEGRNGMIDLEYPVVDDEWKSGPGVNLVLVRLE